MYFYQLLEEHRLLAVRERDLVLRRKIKPGQDEKIKAEEKSLGEERKALLYNTVINSAYFPLTVHWSLETSSFPDVGVGICGTTAAIAQLITAWKGA